MRFLGWRAVFVSGVLLFASVPTRADCSFCELAAMQDASFAIGHRFLTLMPRQSELARRGVRGGGFAPTPEEPSDRDEGWVAAIIRGTREPGANGWAAWAAAFGGSGSRGDSAIAGSVQHRLDAAAVAGGIDYRVSRTLLVGGSMAFATGGHSVDTRDSRGSMQSALLGLYGAWSNDTLYADLAVFHGYGDAATRRFIRGEVNEQTSGAFSSHQFGGRLEAGWRALPFPLEVTPFAALTVQHLREAGYAEAARIVSDGTPGFLGWTVAGRSAWSVRSELGLQFISPFALQVFAPMVPRVRVAWAHEFQTDRSVTALLTTSPATPPVTQGMRAARDALLVSAGMHILLGHQISGFAQFDGEWSASGHFYAASGGLRLSW